jgi:hypothetical protein
MEKSKVFPYLISFATDVRTWSNNFTTLIATADYCINNSGRGEGGQEGEER